MLRGVEVGVEGGMKWVLRGMKWDLRGVVSGC